MRGGPEVPRADEFLSDFEGRAIDWSQPTDAPSGIAAIEVLYGRGDRPLEIAVARSAVSPKADDLRRLWKTRANRGAPVLLVVLHPGGDGPAASVVGTDGDPAPLLDRSAGQIERIALAALDEPSRHQAARALDRLLGSLSRDGLAAGLINSGLFAAHELRKGVPRRSDWEQAGRRSLPLLGKTGRPLLESLGFSIQSRGSTLLALAGADETRHAIAVILDEDESFDRTSQRFGGVSPVSQALAQAQHERLPWVVALRRNQIRLYPADPDIGVGRKGLTETYAELDLTLLDDAEAGYLALLFSPEALERGGSVEQIIHHSSIYATELGARLRQRIYEDVVPELAVAVARRMGAQIERDLDSAYHRTLVILFRLLFVAYAEDRGLLPFERNERYTRNALKTYARDFASDPGQEFSVESTSIWEDLVQVWNAIDTGEPRWDVPAYNGGLFSTDPQTHPDGAAVSALSLTNAEVGPALTAMLVDTDADGALGPVDFRSLSVREFGTIYEGLLESSLSFAPSDLTLDRNQTFVPAKDGEAIVVHAGEVYFHNASGQRKSTGSYFTKSFAVEHLLDTALEPALDDHLARVGALLVEDDTGERAATAFFDFRVADIAMGSGHFLVATIDRIEARFSAFLAEHPLPPIADELRRLESAARAALGEQGEVAEIEPSLLLRRQIARRCIYGLDINLIAVELARLGIWIHTFVPGLPMSSLDHGLVHGNSLTGMGTIDETVSVLAPDTRGGQMSVFRPVIEEALERSKETLVRVARTSEATKQEVQQAAEEHRRALVEAGEARLLMDAAVAVRLGLIPVPNGPDEAIESITARTDAAEKARVMLADLAPAHFPVLFPEVFLRERSGFDVILGNPPWQETTLEEDAFWARHQPGLRSLPQREQELAKTRWREERPDLVALYQAELDGAEALRLALTRGGYPGMGTGDPDLYKAFCWRFWHLSAIDGGRIGVVLPRSALAAKGSAQFRKEVFAKAEAVDITTLLNTRGWVFDEAEHRYTIGLTALSRREGAQPKVSLRGPYSSKERYTGGMARESTVFYGSDIAEWNDTASLPLLPTDESVAVFAQLRRAPRLDLDDGTSWRARPYAELHATNDKKWMDVTSKECPEGFWPVFKGESFDIWTPDTGTYYAWADPDVLLPLLREKRTRGSRLAKSVFSECGREWVNDPGTLPCLHPRIAFRDVTRATDSRTVRVALVPPNVFIANQAPYLVWPRGSRADEAYLLGVLSAIPLDWYARRFVETHMNFFIFNPLPVPRPPARHPLHQRVVEIAGRLACPDDRFADWAAAVGVECGAVDTARKDDMVAELDAAVAHLYALTREQLVHIFETFHEGWDYARRLDAVLDHYDRWAPVAAASLWNEAGGA